MLCRPVEARALRRIKTRGETIPEPLRAELTAFSRHVVEDFGSFFASGPRVKFRVARLFAAQLPAGAAAGRHTGICNCDRSDPLARRSEVPASPEDAKANLARSSGAADFDVDRSSRSAAGYR
jgi:hypothetical protein